MSERIFMALLVGAFFLMAAVFLYQRKKREKQIEELIMYLMRIQDGPETVSYTNLDVSKRQHTKLCYSGEGADEFFGGYNMYRNAERYGENLKTFYVGNTNIMKEDEKKRILKKYDPDVLPIELVERIYEETEGLDPLAKMSNVDIQIWLEGDIYLNVDKMSTAAGLEIRMPLTDRRIFDIASRMPSRFKEMCIRDSVCGGALLIHYV